MDRFDKVLAAIKREIDLIPAQRQQASRAQERSQRLIAQAQESERKRERKRLLKEPGRDSSVMDSDRGSRLMNLPVEIRQKILEFAIDPIRGPVFYQPRLGKRRSLLLTPPKKRVPLPTPPIARHCGERLELESMLTLIEQTMFVIRSYVANQAIQRWLSNIDFTKLKGDTTYRTGFDAVRALSFQCFSMFAHQVLPKDELNQDILLMARCRNLHKINITFRDYDLVYNNVEHPKPVHLLRDEYRLDGLLSLRSLRFVHLDVTYRILGNDPAVDKSLADLVGWLREEYDKRGIPVRVSHI